MEFSAAKEPSNATAGEPVYEGALVGIRNNRLVGWAWNVARPYDAIGVDFLVGQQRLGTVQADQFDQELAMARKGNGFHAFTSALDTLPTGNGPFSLQAYAANTAVALGKPLVFHSREEMTLLLTSRSLVGELEGLRDAAVCGWVSDLDTPDDVPDLEVEFDGYPLAPAFMRDDRIVHDGRLVTGWRFSAPLPLETLDGKVHALTAQVGRTAIKGSPLAVGPSAMNGVLQAMNALARDVASVTQRLAILPPVESTDGLIELLTGRMLDRVDMLMAVYRDGIEQELALMRSQLLAVATAGPSAIATPHKTEPLQVLMASPDIKRAPRAPEGIKIDFSESSPVISGTMDLVDDPYGPAYAMVRNSVELELPRPARVTQTLVIQGTGATTALGLLAWKFEAGGCPILGQYEVMADGTWRFVGQFAQMTPDTSRLDRLMVTSADNYISPETVIEPLKMVRLELSDGYVVRREPGEEMPVSVAFHIAGKFEGRSWHNPEKGADGWYRWGGDAPQFITETRAGEGRRLTLIGENHVPGDLAGCAVRINGVTQPCDLAYVGAGKRRWTLKTVVADHETRLSTEVAVPKGFAKSPAEFEGSGDRRILSVSVRAVAIDGVGVHAAA